MGILSGLLGASNPAAQWAAQNRGWLGQVGAGLASGPTFEQGLANAAQMGPQGQRVDDAYRVAEAEKAARAKQINQTAQYLAQTFPDLAEAVNAGMPMDAAWNEAMKRSQPGYGQAGGGAAPASVQEYEFARNNGFEGTFADWMAKKTPQTNVTTNVGGTDKFYDSLDAKLADQTAGLINEGMNARTNNAKLTQLETLLQTAPQGAQGAMTIAAGELGIPLDGMDEAQAAQALINQLVPEQRPPGTGPMSDADLALFKQSVPRIINQPGGNRIILQTMKAINEYTIAQSEIAAMVANREINPAEGRKMQAAIPNPLDGINRIAPATPTSSGGVPQGVDPGLWEFMTPEERALW